MTSSEISRIHNNRIARHNFKYYGPEGTVYIGLADGRLRRISDGTTTIVSGGGIQSVTGLNTDTADPANPVIQISVDGVTITGAGTPVSPLVATASAGGVTSVTDDGNGVVTVDNTIPTAPVVQFQGVNVDGVTITGDGTSGNPLVASGGGTVDILSPLLLMGG
jgi:hypothetical protein